MRRRYTRAEEEEWTCSRCAAAWREAMSSMCEPCQMESRLEQEASDDE